MKILITNAMLDRLKSVFAQVGQWNCVTFSARASYFNLDNNRARAYCSFGKCGGCLDIFLSPILSLFFLLLS